MQNRNKNGLRLLESRRRWWKLFTCKLHRGWNSLWLSFTLASNFYGVTALATSHLSLWNEVIWLHLDSDQLILSRNHLVCIVFLRETLAKYSCHVGKTQILNREYIWCPGFTCFTVEVMPQRSRCVQSGRAHSVPVRLDAGNVAWCSGTRHRWERWKPPDGPRALSDGSRKCARKVDINENDKR